MDPEYTYPECREDCDLPRCNIWHRECLLDWSQRVEVDADDCDRAYHDMVDERLCREAE